MQMFSQTYFNRHVQVRFFISSVTRDKVSGVYSIRSFEGEPIKAEIFGSTLQQNGNRLYFISPVEQQEIYLDELRSGGIHDEKAVYNDG